MKRSALLKLYKADKSSANLYAILGGLFVELNGLREQVPSIGIDRAIIVDTMMLEIQGQLTYYQSVLMAEPGVPLGDPTDPNAFAFTAEELRQEREGMVTALFKKAPPGISPGAIKDGESIVEAIERAAKEVAALREKAGEEAPPETSIWDWFWLGSSDAASRYRKEKNSGATPLAGDQDKAGGIGIGVGNSSLGWGLNPWGFEIPKAAWWIVGGGVLLWGATRK